jgi:membrane protease YdiL (CAAX protease family)
MSTSAVPAWYQPEPTRLPPRDPPPGWQAGPAADTEQRRIRLEVLAMLLLAAIPSFIIGLEGINDPQTISTDLSGAEVLYLVTSAAGPAAMAVYLLWRDRRLGVAGFGRRSAGFIAGYGLLGLVVVYLSLFAAAMIAGNLYIAFGGDIDDLAGSDTEIDFTAASLIVAYVISITAGVTEEIVFRAYAITRLEELGWRRAAFIVPGVVFTVLHLYQGVWAIALIGGVTVAFTWLYRWRRSIWPVIVAHALFDAVQLTWAALASA